MWEPGLPAMAECLRQVCQRAHRYRRQASSHRGMVLSDGSGTQQKARQIIDQPGFFIARVPS